MSYVLLILLFKITLPYNKEAKNAIFFNFSFVLLNENVFNHLKQKNKTGISKLSILVLL